MTINFVLNDEEQLNVVNEHDCVWIAYHRLINALHDKKATKTDYSIAMEEAIGYLAQILDDEGCGLNEICD